MSTQSSFVSKVAAAFVTALFTAVVAPALAQDTPRTEVATFGSGCFWCTEADFDKVPGVLATVSGFMGGKTKNPTYYQVTTGTTGHAEVVQITYDPAKVSYERLLRHYWRNVDPHDASGQFCDKGSHYRPVIFTHGSDQQAKAQASKQAIEKSGKLKAPIVVTIEKASEFTKAEDYHQDFYKKNPGHYTLYRQGCGRDARLRQVWGKEEVGTN